MKYVIKGLGTGITAPAIVKQQAFTLSEFNGHEYVVAFDTMTGRRTWIAPLGVESKDYVGMHPLMRWLSQRTPTVADGKLYAVTAYGALTCLSTLDGSQLWTKDLRQAYGVKRLTFGFCDYPLVDGDLLICVPGGTRATIVAMNRHSGEEVWSKLLTRVNPTDQSEKVERSSYAAAIAYPIKGREVYVAVTNSGVHFVSRSNGDVLATYDRVSRSVANSHTPLLDGNAVLITNGYNGGVARLELFPEGQFDVLREQYHSSIALDAFQDTGVIVGDKLFHNNRGFILMCLDVKSGQPIAQRRLPMRFAHTYAESRLYCVEVSGSVSLIDAESADLAVRSQFEIEGIAPARGVTLPVIANKCLYLRFDDQLFCFDLAENSPSREHGSQVVEHLAPNMDPQVAGRRLPVPIYSPTPGDVAQRMLVVSGIKPGQKLVDLGSGDGRIVVAAVKQYGAHAIGYEIDEELIGISRARIEQENIANLARIEATDMYDADLSQVDVLAIYLYPVIMDELKKQIRRMPEGAVIVSHQFRFPGIEPDSSFEMKSEETGENHTIYRYRVPLKEPQE